MGNNSFTLVLVEWGYKTIKHKLQCKLSKVLTEIYITSTRDAIKDEISRLQVKLTQDTFKTANDIAGLELELELIINRGL